MKKIFVLSLIGSIFIFLYLTLVTNNHITYETIDNRIKDGKVTWQKKACVECHTLFGNGGYNAPDLTKVLSEKKERDIEEFLTNRPVIRTAHAKRHINLTQEEIDKLLTYLKYVSTIRTNSWPPNPLQK